MTNESLTGQRLHRTRWMVVDDDESILQFVALLLAGLTDARICCFRSAAAALRAFTAAPDAYELVLTDLEMPGMSGIDLCRQLRARAPRLLILLATGAGLVTREEARRFGFCNLLHKPFPLVALRNALAAAGVLRRPVNVDEEPVAHCCATA